MTGPAMIPVVMDVDTGIDDAIALLLAVRSPVIDLVGVGTVLGNVDVTTATRNTLRVLEVAGADVPVATGSDRHLLEPDRDARWVHGDDGLGETSQPEPTRAPADEHAVDQLLRLSHEHAGALVVIAVGPLTNLALALRRDPTLADRLARIVVMGGSAQAGGNRGPWAEANIASDPEAAAVVFGAEAPRTMIGLDVTSQLTLDDDDVARLAAAPDPVAAFAARILPFYIDFYAGIHGARRCAVHDALAVAAVIEPTLLTTRRLPVTVETAGTHTRGMTVVDVRPRPADDVPVTEVALEVDAAAARALLLAALRAHPEPRD
jgi:purine nucleosidase